MPTTADKRDADERHAERGVPTATKQGTDDTAHELRAPPANTAIGMVEVCIDDVITDAKLVRERDWLAALPLGGAASTRTRPESVPGFDARLLFAAAPATGPAGADGTARKPPPFRHHVNAYDAGHPHSSPVARLMLTPGAKFCTAHRSRESRRDRRNYSTTCDACREAMESRPHARIHMHGAASRMGATTAMHAALLGRHAQPGSIRLRRVDVAFDMPAPVGTLLPVFGDSWRPEPPTFVGDSPTQTRYFKGPLKAQIRLYDLHACAASRRHTRLVAPHVPAHAARWPHATRLEVSMLLDSSHVSPDRALARLQRITSEIDVIDIRTVSDYSPLVLLLPSLVAGTDPTASAFDGSPPPARLLEELDLYVRSVPRVHLRDVLALRALSLRQTLMALANAQPT
jgi:hypothetical protein